MNPLEGAPASKAAQKKPAANLKLVGPAADDCEDPEEEELDGDECVEVDEVPAQKEHPDTKAAAEVD